MTGQESKEEELLYLCVININFGIIDACSNLDTDNKALTITLKDSQFPTSISTIYIPPGSIQVLPYYQTFLITDDNPNPIKIINNAATILTDTIIDIHNQLAEKSIRPNTSIPLSIRSLILQKNKKKRAFIKSRNSFLKSTLNAN